MIARSALRNIAIMINGPNSQLFECEARPINIDELRFDRL